jgi:hypothetical protein
MPNAPDQFTDMNGKYGAQMYIYIDEDVEKH